MDVARRRLDSRLASAKAAVPELPPSGWVQGVRGALGMSQRDLARRLGVTSAAVAKLEASEQAGTVRLDTLRRAAAAMDCEVAYVIVPRTSLEQTRRERIEVLTRRVAQRLQHTMVLENQPVEFTEDELDDIRRDIAAGELWREL